MNGTLLICTYYFPPVGTPRSYRWLEFVKYLFSKGWKIDVLTINSYIESPNYDLKLLEEIPNEVRIFRTYPGIIHRFPILLRSETTDSRQFTSPYTSTTFKQTIGKFLRNIFEKRLPIFIPDRAVTWLPFALIKGKKLIKENHYDVIISSGIPFTCHIAGFFLKWFSGGKPWIADYGDPWVYNPVRPFPKWRSFIDKKIESRILKSVNKVIVTTDKTKEHYLNLYRYLKSEDIHVITQGFSHNAFDEASPEITDKFRIVYTGIFYKQRAPFIFFDALNGIKKIWKDLEVIIAGEGNIPNDEYKEYAEQNGLSEIVQFIGFVPRRKALSLQKGASLLLLIGNSGGIQIPGKIYEYFAARRPILSIKMDSYDIAAMLVERHKRGISCKNDLQEIIKSINYLYKLWKNKQLESEFKFEDVDEFCWERLTEMLEEKILEVIQN